MLKATGVTGGHAAVVVGVVFVVHSSKVQVVHFMGKPDLGHVGFNLFVVLFTLNFLGEDLAQGVVEC